jgi:two-component system sensor histidine kinase CpxA
MKQGMTHRWPLWRKIAGLALLNLLLLVLVAVVFAASQFRLDPESLLLGPAKDRIEAIADSFELDLESTPQASRDQLCQAYALKYNAGVVLISPEGNQVAGQAETLPPALIDRLRRAPAADRPPPGKKKRREDGPPPAPDGRPPVDEYGNPIGGGLPPPPNGEAPPRPDEGSPGRPRDVGGRRNQAFLFITTDPLTYWAGARIPVTASDMQGRLPGVLLMRSTSLFSSDVFFDWRPWTGAAAVVLGISLLCWLPFVRGLTHSIAQMDRVTQQIAEGRFEARVASSRGDELGHLGGEIDRLAARLRGFVTNQKRFLGDIAHELSAPIARIQFALGILEQKASDADQSHVARLNEEIQEMSALVNELLSFSKAGLAMDSVPLSAVNLAAVAQRVAARESITGAKIEVNVPEDLTVRANEAYLQRSISNVLRNAVRYAATAGPIALRAVREGREVAISVTDSGPGLPESEVEEVFAPFYRPEAARTRETGGVGLGLAIVRSCIEACGGTVGCRNRKPAGLEVWIRLPSADAAASLH